MIFGLNTTRDILKLPQISLAYRLVWNSEISLVVFVPDIATNHAITYTNNVNSTGCRRQNGWQPRSTGDEVAFVSVEQEKMAEDFKCFAK